MATAEQPSPRLRVSPEALLQHSRDLIAVLDTDAVVTFVNPAVSMFGFSPEEVVGRHVSDFIPDDYLEAMQRRFEELRGSENGQLEPMVHRVKDAAGEWRWVEASHADRIGDPDIRGIVVTIRDVTDRIEAERALRESEERFRRLAENAPDIVFRVLPGEEGFDYLSPAVEEVIGYPPQAFYDNPELAREIIHPDDVPALDIGTVPEGTSVVRIRHKDGSWRWMERRTVHVRDEHGELIAAEGISRDITETRRAEERFRETRERLSRVIETMSDAVLIFDVVGNLEYVNPAAVELFDVSRVELLSRTFADPAWDLRDADGAEVPLEERPVHRALTEGEPVIGMELSAVRGSGGRVHWETSASPLRGADGAVVGVVAVLRDLSRQRAAAEKLEEALERERAVTEELRELNALKNTFLQAVSHELRTPLTSVMGFADLLEQHERLSSDQFAQIVRRLRANAVRLDRLLSDLLDLDRLSRGTLEPRRTAVDVHDLIGRTIEQVGLLGRVKVTGQQVVAKIDGPRTERIVENLITNAHKHTPPDGEIVAAVERRDDGVLIRVDDRGPGIPDEDKEAMFEAFRQGDSPAAQTGGAGIGLSLVAAFAGLHDGEAWVEDREGGGSSFRVFLPAEVIDADQL